MKDDYIRHIAMEAARSVLSEYDRRLPARVRAISESPRCTHYDRGASADAPSAPPVRMMIGERRDEEGRPLFEVTGPTCLPLEDLERIIASYRRCCPAIR